MHEVVTTIILPCVSRKKTRRICQQQCRGYQSPRRSSRHCKCHSSHSSGRQSHHHIPSHSPSCSPSHSASPQWHDHSHCWHTPFWHSQDNINVILGDSVETTTLPEGSLFREGASDGQLSFYTQLQLPTKKRTQLITTKIDPGAQVNTIPWASTGSSSPIKSLTPGTPNLVPYPLQPTPWCHMMDHLSPS